MVPRTAQAYPMGRTLRSLALAAVAASYVQAFAPAALPQVAGIRPSALRAGAAAVSMQEAAPPAVSRRGLLSGALASAVLVAGGSSASADMLKAACTLQSCPEPPSGAYKTDTLQISKGKFTGQGYQFKRPTEDYFKRVQVFDRVTARPGSVLLRDKKNPDTAIFSNVEQIKNADYTWKPTIVEVIFEVSTKCHLMGIVGLSVTHPLCGAEGRGLWAMGHVVRIPFIDREALRYRHTKRPSVRSSSSSPRKVRSRPGAWTPTRTSMWWRRSWETSLRRCTSCLPSQRLPRTCTLSTRKPRRVTGPTSEIFWLRAPRA